ncbi:MAG: AMP-binding protein, partial [Desulfobacterales bacterium]|nr:AMP-binding protein [Desulfobacterales bacterium]
MTISKWMTAGTVLKMMAMQYPDKQGAGDKFRKMTFKEWNDRSCRLSNALTNMGVKKGDRFAILAYNCVEWLEIYAAAAKGGQITVPIMFRLAPPEMEYVINHSECKAFFVAKEFVQVVDSIRSKLSAVPPANYVYWGDEKAPEGYEHYESVIAKAS